MSLYVDNILALAVYKILFWYRCIRKYSLSQYVSVTIN